MSLYAEMNLRQMNLVAELIQRQATLVSNGIRCIVWHLDGRDIKVPHVGELPDVEAMQMLDSAEAALTRRDSMQASLQ